MVRWGPYFLPVLGFSQWQAGPHQLTFETDIGTDGLIEWVFVYADAL